MWFNINEKEKMHFMTTLLKNHKGIMNTLSLGKTSDSNVNCYTYEFILDNKDNPKKLLTKKYFKECIDLGFVRNKILHYIIKQIQEDFYLNSIKEIPIAFYPDSKDVEVITKVKGQKFGISIFAKKDISIDEVISELINHINNL